MKDNNVSVVLKNAGLKITPHRIAIYEYLEKFHKPVTINQIHVALVSTGIDKVTVYRVISSLQEVLLVRQIELGEDQSYFELVDEHDHHHIVCKKCRKISDFTGCGISDIITDALSQTGFAQVDAHSLELFGLCKKCK